MPEHLTVVGPKLSLNVVGAKLSLSQNFARHSKFRVCVRKPRSRPFRPGPTNPLFANHSQYPTPQIWPPIFV